MRRTLTRLAHAVAQRALAGPRLAELALALRLRQLFARHGIDTVIDVGANRGQYRDFLRDRVGFDGSIVSFEPVPELAAALAARAVRDPLWTVHPCALGAEPGTMEFNVMEESVFSSFRAPVPAGSDDQQRMNTVARTLAVPVDTLDARLAGLDLRRAYLKLDTQGFDLEVLKGGNRAVSAVAALQTEVSFVALYDGMPGYAEAIAAFEAFGLRVADLFLVSTDDAGRAIEFDCLMVR
jgi:hypothetical protein